MDEMLREITGQYLLELEQAYNDTGDGALILEAIYLCSLRDLPLPGWVQKAYLSAYRKVRQYEAGSWDEIFGKPHPKGTHLEAKRERWEKQERVYFRVKEILRNEPKTPIDAALFERVGRELGIGSKTKTEQIYYEMKKRQETFPKNF